MSQQQHNAFEVPSVNLYLEHWDNQNFFVSVVFCAKLKLKVTKYLHQFILFVFVFAILNKAI